MKSDFELEQMNKMQKAVHYLQEYGLVYTGRKALKKLGVPISDESAYMTWCRRQDADRRERNRQKQEVLSPAITFSVCCESEDAAARILKHQTYRDYQILKLPADARVSAADAAATGDYLLFLGTDVILRPEYLYEMAVFLQSEPYNKAELIYTDEDNSNGRKRLRPYFKPQKSRQLLLNFQYLGSCFVMKKTLLEEIINSSSIGSRALFANHWYELALEAMHVCEQVYRIPRVLFSNLVPTDHLNHFVRATDASQKEALSWYLSEHQIRAEIEDSDVPGFYHLIPAMEEEPLVSIIIPNKDHIDDLMICLNSLKEKNTYQNYEVIIAENNSEDPATFAAYEKLQKEDDKIHVVKWEGIFNYSAINNFAVRASAGSLLLFLNNDTEIITSDSLRELVQAALLPGAGASGAMLYYADDTIQHGGIILGMGGFAAHALWSLKDRDEKYYPYSLCQREMSGATGACLMVRREVYEKVEGMGEEFVVALNDVDLCFKIRSAGYEIIFDPYAKLYHYESKSRGYEDTMEKQERFRQEIDRLQTKWKDLLEAKDPYYNPNLTLHRADYSMDI